MCAPSPSGTAPELGAACLCSSPRAHSQDAALLQLAAGPAITVLAFVAWERLGGGQMMV